MYTSFVLMSTFYQKEIVLTNVRIKKEKNSFAESFSLSELCDLKPFLVILILTRYEHPHQIYIPHNNGFFHCYAEFLCFAFAQKHTFKRKKTHKKVVKQTAHFCIEKSEQAIHSLFRRGNAGHKDICAEGALAKMYVLIAFVFFPTVSM